MCAQAAFHFCAGIPDLRGGALRMAWYVPLMMGSCEMANLHKLVIELPTEGDLIDAPPPCLTQID